MLAAGEQPYFRFTDEAAIVLAQFLIQDGAQRDLAVLAALAFANVNALGRFVDVGNLQVDYLGAARAGTVRRHEKSSVIRSIGRLDEAIDFVHAQHQRQALFSFGIGSVFDAPRFVEGLHVEEAQSRYLLTHRAAT